MSQALTTEEVRWVKISTVAAKPEPAKVVFDHTGAVIEVWLFGEVVKDFTAKDVLIGQPVKEPVWTEYVSARKALPIAPLKDSKPVEDAVRRAEEKPEDPDKAAKDGLA